MPIHNADPLRKNPHARKASFFSLEGVQQALLGSPPDDVIGKGVRFVHRIYKLRLLGSSIGFFCVASAFVQRPVAWPLWVLLIFHGYLWPHVARHLALKSRIPYRAEHLNLVGDSTFGGFWIITMHGNLVPTMVIVAMLSMNNMAAGGSALFLRGLAGMAVGMLLALLPGGFQFAPESDLHTVLACIPMLVCYPLALGKTTYGMSQKLAERSREFETVSQRDGLTGLLNRRYWETLLVEEFNLCHQAARRSCLLLLDLDHFKSINDAHGHLVGDEVLKNFARLLQDNLRADDLIGRYGGEEFVVILRDISLTEAHALASRLIEQVRRQHAPDDPLRGCTISAGLVSFRNDMDAHYSWLQCADHAMYRAKQSGRDRLVVDGE